LKIVGANYLDEFLKKHQLTIQKERLKLRLLEGGKRLMIRTLTPSAVAFKIGSLQSMMRKENAQAINGPWDFALFESRIRWDGGKCSWFFSTNLFFTE
jgi:hypothetical protein